MKTTLRTLILAAVAAAAFANAAAAAEQSELIDLYPTKAGLEMTAEGRARRIVFDQYNQLFRVVVTGGFQEGEMLVVEITNDDENWSVAGTMMFENGEARLRMVSELQHNPNSLSVLGVFPVTNISGVRVRNASQILLEGAFSRM